jgi:type VI secretion system secreted protein VgrG
MTLLELSFASGLDGLSVRHFSVSEGMSSLFEISLVALSPLDDIDFESVVGGGASFRIEGGNLGGMGQSRAWTGICSHFEQVQAESTGLSTYAVRIVPHLWLATQRKNCRIYQHLSIPEIVQKLLAEWQIKPVMKLDQGAYSRLEYRVQYDETDYAFICRLLEEAGISFHFALDEGGGQTQLVLADAPEKGEPRRAIKFVDHPNPEAREEYLTGIQVSQRIRPGAFTIRDFDFTRRPDYELLGKSNAGKGIEERLEQYRYEPNAFKVESKAGDAGAQAASARHDEKEGKELAKRSLDGERKSRVEVKFGTNALSLAPGTIVPVQGHPHPLLGGGKALLVTGLDISGSQGSEWHASARAVPNSEPFRPARSTPRPRITGMQSAVVVGAKGEEIHTDEYGRVRVQFHWDREGHMDDKSSCWIRVSQGWAGSGYGMLNLPRVGQEVMVAFFEGNPDDPVVVGRAFNNTSRVPYSLPKHKTRSTWKTNSTPNSPDGYNEIMFEDQKGAELVSVRAQRDLEKLVRMDEIERTGQDRTVNVGRSRKTTVGQTDSTMVGTRHEVVVGASKLNMSDKHIRYTTGQATLTFDGPDISLEAEGNITIVSKSGDVVLKGGPNVKINCD